MSFVPLSQLPWRRALAPAGLPAGEWVDPATLVSEIARWRNWLADKPPGSWLLCERDPLVFCGALLALWETGRVAVLTADDRPETLARIGAQIDGHISCTAQEVLSPVAAFGRPHPVPAELDAQNQALVLFTSGSSGEPLALVKTFRQLDAELQVHAQLWPLDATSAVISQVSHQHIYGLLTGVLHPLCSASAFCSMDCHFPEVLAQRLDEASHNPFAITLVSSPPQLSRLPTHITWPAAGSLARIFSSGAPLDADHARHAKTLLHAPVVEIYGSTETGGIAWRQQQAGPAWTPLPDVQIRVDKGCLSLRSAFLPDPNTWCRHPDRISLVDDRFILLGREDRLVKVAGKRLSLAQMENALVAIEDVQTARCVELGRPDGRLGVIVTLPAERVPREHSPRHELIRHLRSTLAAQFEAVTLPRYWRFVEALPTNAQGKLERQLIQRLFKDLEDPRLPRWLGETINSQNERTMTLEVPEKLIFLDGHFERFQLVPGVVLVQWAMQLGQQAFGERAGFRGVEQLKFQRPLRPGMRCSLKLTQRAEGIAFTYESHEGRHATGRIMLAATVPTP
jgi:acyl-coenzyme A synthetase/AMP-(fatty) acid ligase/3-hydroxymyristoyl/3-hydroxydecanoyl-(acyl carrier protein) dehydratase